MAQGAAMQQQINFTRANENEADRVGMSFLAAAGFDPYGMPDFFETMGRRNADHRHQPQRAAGNPAVASGHHQPHRRVARARRAVQGHQAHRRRRVSYALTRERLRVLATPPEDNVRRYYADRREQQDQTAGERYGEALASYQAGNARASLDTLTELAREYPQVPMLQSTLGQALMSAGDTDEALATFQRALDALAAQHSAHHALCRSAAQSRPGQDRRTPCCSTCSTTSRRRPSRSASRRSRPAAPATPATRLTT